MIDRIAALLTALALLGAASAGAQTAAPAEPLAAPYAALFAQIQQSREKSAGLADGQAVKSRYEILEDFFAQAPAPASLSDFDLESDVKAGKSSQKCVGIWPGQPNETVPEGLSAAVFVLPAVPGQGPLLPGKPEERQTKLFNGDPGSIDWSAAGAWDQLQTSSSATELMSRFVYNGVGATLAARKSGGLIAFRFTWDDDQTIEASGKGVEYGYCYRVAPRP